MRWACLVAMISVVFGLIFVETSQLSIHVACIQCSQYLYYGAFYIVCTYASQNQWFDCHRSIRAIADSVLTTDSTTEQCRSQWFMCLLSPKITLRLKIIPFFIAEGTLTNGLQGYSECVVPQTTYIKTQSSTLRTCSLCTLTRKIDWMLTSRSSTKLTYLLSSSLHPRTPSFHRTRSAQRCSDTTDNAGVVGAISVNTLCGRCDCMRSSWQCLCVCSSLDKWSIAL